MPDPISNEALVKENEHLRQRIAELETRFDERTAELHYNQTLLQSVIDSLPAVVYAKDLEGHYLLLNRLYADLLGMPIDDVLGKTDTQLRPQEAEQWRAHDQRILATGQSLMFEEHGHLPDGVHTYSVIKYPLRDAQGQIMGTAGIATDITERKRTEEELRTFKALVETASDAIALTRLDGTIIYINAAYRELYRCGDDHLGQSIGVIVAEEDQHQLPGVLQEIVEQGAWRGKLTHVRSDGSTFPALESCFTIKDENGTPQYMVGIVRDYTEQQRAEQERTHLQQQIIEAQQAALRELSTPLIPIAAGVVIMPLIGTIDSARAQMVMETLLEGVSHHHAELAILDITGVSVVDTQVAQALVQAAQSVRLLGAQVILTGIQPQIAQTLVQLGVDLSEIITRSSLQSGIARALHNGRA